MTITLPTIDDISVIYGSRNVRDWADMDNDNDSTKINARVTYAVGEAYRYIYQRLSNRFDVSSWLTLPAEVFSLIAKRAGIELYGTPRGLTDGADAQRQLAAMSIAIEAMLERILSGQMQMLDVTDETQPTQVPGCNITTAPFVREERLRARQCTGEPVLTDDMNFIVTSN